MRPQYLFALCLIVIALAPSAALATIIPSGLDVDFRTWTAIPANASIYSVDDVTVTALPSRAKLSQDTTDGLGITYGLLGDPNEIDRQEQLVVEFDTVTAVVGAWITNLFKFPDAFFSLDGEMGIVRLYDAGGFVTSFVFKGKDADQGNGEIFVNFGAYGTNGVTKLKFERYDRTIGNEFSVAGLDLASSSDVGDVPEPSTALLCFAGLGIALALRRKLAH